MERHQYLIYLENTMNLIRSLLIISKEIGEMININLTEKGIEVDRDDLKTWKYYVNLNGEYHDADGDPIVITSRDTFTEIELTKENMEIHPHTRLSLFPYTNDYKKLVEERPDMETFIRGVVNPIPYEKSISVKDYTIISWDNRLIQPNEHDIIERLQTYVNGFILRHHNRAYGLVDDLYIPAMLGVLYQYLFPALLTIRLSNVHTNKVHNFHLWSFLAGYGNLDKWRFTLSLDQSLYLYRNIVDITTNVGSISVFNKLTEKLLSATGLPLYGYDLRHDNYDLLEELKYKSLAARYRIDKKIEVANLSETKTIEDLISSTIVAARDNAAVSTYTRDDVIAGMGRSPISRVPTKVLESEIINSIENEEIEFTRLALNEWIHLSCTNKYIVNIEVIHRESGINHIFKIKELLVLYSYAVNMSLTGLPLIDIPDYKLNDTRRLDDPSFGTLRGLSDTLSDRWIINIINSQTMVNVIRSVNDFNQYCISVSISKTNSRLAYTSLGLLPERSQGELIARAFHSPNTCSTMEGTYRNFFDTKLIDDSLLTQEVCKDLAPILFHLATGVDYDSSSAYGSTQRDMLEIMSQLSSYNVQYIGSESYANAEPVRWCVFRQSRITAALYLKESHLRLPNAGVKYSYAIGHDTDLGRMLLLKPTEQFIAAVYTDFLEIVVKIKEGGKIMVYDTITMPGFRILSQTSD